MTYVQPTDEDLKGKKIHFSPEDNVYPEDGSDCDDELLEHLEAQGTILSICRPQCEDDNDKAKAFAVVQIYVALDQIKTINENNWSLKETPVNFK